jgi:hypothetical protein
VQVVELLIKHKANVDSVNEKGKTPLYYACKAGYFDIVKILVTAGASLNRPHNLFGGEWLSVVEAAKGHTDIVRFLKQKGANNNPRPSSAPAPEEFQQVFGGNPEQLLLRGLILSAGIPGVIQLPGNATLPDGSPCRFASVYKHKAPQHDEDFVPLPPLLKQEPSEEKLLKIVQQKAAKCVIAEKKQQKKEQKDDEQQKEEPNVRLMRVTSHIVGLSNVGEFERIKYLNEFEQPTVPEDSLGIAGKLFRVLCETDDVGNLKKIMNPPPVGIVGYLKKIVQPSPVGMVPRPFLDVVQNNIRIVAMEPIACIHPVGEPLNNNHYSPPDYVIYQDLELPSECMVVSHIGLSFISDGKTKLSTNVENDLHSRFPLNAFKAASWIGDPSSFYALAEFARKDAIAQQRDQEFGEALLRFESRLLRKLTHETCLNDVITAGCAIGETFDNATLKFLKKKGEPTPESRKLQRQALRGYKGAAEASLTATPEDVAHLHPDAASC